MNELNQIELDLLNKCIDDMTEQIEALLANLTTFKYTTKEDWQLLTLKSIKTKLNRKARQLNET